MRNPCAVTAALWRCISGRKVWCMSLAMKHCKHCKYNAVCLVYPLSVIATCPFCLKAALFFGETMPGNYRVDLLRFPKLPCSGYRIQYAYDQCRDNDKSFRLPPALAQPQCKRCNSVVTTQCRKVWMILRCKQCNTVTPIDTAGREMKSLRVPDDCYVITEVRECIRCRIAAVPNAA